MTFRKKIAVFVLVTWVIGLAVSLAVPRWLSPLIPGIAAPESPADRSLKAASVAYNLYVAQQDQIKLAAQDLAATFYTRGLVERLQRPQVVASSSPAAGAASEGFQSAAGKEVEAAWRALRSRHDVDYFVLTDPQGIVLARQNGLPVQEERISNNSLVDAIQGQAIAERNAPNSFLVLSSSDIEPEGFLKTVGFDEAARISSRIAGRETVLKDALVIEGCAPIVSSPSTLLAIVLVGRVMNNSKGGNSVAGEIRNLVFSSAEQPGPSPWGISLLAKNAIVSSTLASDDDSAVIGSSLRAGLSDARTTSAETIAGIRYQTTFIPIKHTRSNKVVVGYLAASVREDPFLTIVNQIGLNTLLAFGVVLLLLLLGLSLVVGGWSRGIRAVTSTVDRIGLGELNHPFVSTNGANELNDLSESLEKMRMSVKQAIERLRKR